VVQRLRGSRSGRAVLTALRGETGGAVPPWTSESLRQLAEGSTFLAALWDHRLPDHVDFTSVSAADDVIVPADHTDVRGGESVTVNPRGLSDHTAIVRDRGAMAAVRLALEGRRPPCVEWTEGVRGAIEPVVITRLERTAGGLVHRAARANDVLRGRR
jgi:hypothetical protein